MPVLWTSESILTPFILRSVAGALTASIYLSAVLTRCHGRTKTLPAVTLATFAALAFINHRTTLPIEVLACTWSVLYGLVVLSLTQFRHRESIFDGRTTMAARRNLRPLAFLTGAKLLTILCYNLPFACVAMQYFHLLAAPSHVDASKSFNHLIVFMCTRCVLGIFTIFDDANKHESNANAVAVVNHLSAAIYMTVLMCATIVALLLLLLLLLNERLTNCVNAYLVRSGYDFGAGVIVSIAYAVLSVSIDAIGHSAMISATSIDVVSLGKRSQSIVFASCIEHLIDVGFMVAYLSRLIDTRLVLMTMCFCCLSIGIQTILQSTAAGATSTNADRYAPLKSFLKMEII